MFYIMSRQQSRRTVASASAISALALSTRAFAGVCHPDKIGVDVTGPGATKHKGVTNKVIGSIDLANEKVRLNGYQLRTRRACD